MEPLHEIGSVPLQIHLVGAHHHDVRARAVDDLLLDDRGTELGSGREQDRPAREFAQHLTAVIRRERGTAVIRDRVMGEE